MLRFESTLKNYEGLKFGKKSGNQQKKLFQNYNLPNMCILDCVSPESATKVCDFNETN